MLILLNFNFLIGKCDKEKTQLDKTRETCLRLKSLESVFLCLCLCYLSFLWHFEMYAWLCISA